MKTFFLNSDTIRNVRNENTFQKKMIEIADHWNKRADEYKATSESATDDAARDTAQKSEKRARHYSRRIRALSALSGCAAQQAIAFIQSASKNLAIYDALKILSISEKIAYGHKLNAGVCKALRALKRANVLDAHSVSITDISRTHAYKNDTRSSLLLFNKIGLLDRTGRAEETCFSVAKDQIENLEKLLDLV